MTGDLDNIVFIKAGERRPLSSNKTVLLYCLQGVIDCTVANRNIQLIEREMLVINSGEVYGWSADKDSLLLKISIEDYQLHNALRTNKVQIVLSSVEHQTRDYNSLRFILDSIVKQTGRQEGAFSLKSLYYLLWEKVIEDYYIKDISEPAFTAEDEAFAGVCDYIYAHYNENLSLKEISEKYGYSESNFSRWFKKHSGEKYVDFLRKVRLEQALRLLSDTDNTIADIAFLTGFANLSVFNRNFLEAYGIQPSKYRKKQNAEDQENFASSTEIKRYVDASLKRDGNILNKEIELNIDAKKGESVNKQILDILGPVDVNELLSGQLQSVIHKIKDDLRIKYLMVTDVTELKYSGSEETSFEKVSLAIQIIVDQLHLIPIIEIDNKSDWKSLLQYLELRYTKDSISSWIFKINDKEDFTAEEFLRYSKAISDEIKKVIPKAQIGVGQIDLLKYKEKTEEFLSKWSDNPFNFISVFCPSYSEENNKIANSVSDKHYVNTILGIAEELKNRYELAAEIWVEGWDKDLVVGDAYNDSCARACHVLMQISDAMGRAAHMNCSRISDWSHVTSKFPYPICGAGGLISKDGIKKPVYYALFMNIFAAGICIAKGEGYYIAKTEDEYYCLIIYNQQQFNSLYYQHNDSLMPEMLDYIFEDNKSTTFKLNFTNVKNGNYSAASYEIISNKNNILTEWKNLEYKSVLNTGEIDYLNAMCNPKLSYKSEIVSNNVLSLKYVLGPSDFSMIMFTPK